MGGGGRLFYTWASKWLAQSADPGSSRQGPSRPAALRSLCSALRARGGRPFPGKQAASQAQSCRQHQSGYRIPPMFHLFNFSYVARL